MKKIRLDPDSLKVVSFEADRPAAGRGSVHAAQTNPCYDDDDFTVTCTIKIYSGDDPNVSCSPDGCSC